MYCWWKLEGWWQPCQSEVFPPASYTRERFSCCNLPETWMCLSCLHTAEGLVPAVSEPFSTFPGQGPPGVPALRWTFQNSCSICVMGKFPQHSLIPWGISWPQSELCLFLHNVPVLCSFWLQWSIMLLLNLLLGVDQTTVAGALSRRYQCDIAAWNLRSNNYCILVCKWELFIIGSYDFFFFNTAPKEYIFCFPKECACLKCELWCLDNYYQIGQC